MIGSEIWLKAARLRLLPAAVGSELLLLLTGIGAPVACSLLFQARGIAAKFFDPAALAVELAAKPVRELG